MKRILYCFLLFIAASAVCLIAVYGITRYSIRQERPIPNTVIETETADDREGLAAAGQKKSRLWWKALWLRRNIIW